MHADIMTPGNTVVSGYDETDCIHDVYTCMIAQATWICHTVKIEV